MTTVLQSFQFISSVVVLVVQSCLTLRPHGMQPAGSSIHATLQARILEWIAILFSRNSLLWRYICQDRKLEFHLTVQFSSVAQSCPTLCDPMNHSMPPCPSPTPGVHSNSCPLSRWCHPAISSSVVPFSSCPQSFPVSESFPMSQLFASGGQSIGVATSKSVLPMNTQELISFRMDWLDLLAVQGTCKSLLQHHSSKASILLRSAFFIVQLSHPYMTTGKTIFLTRWTFVGKVLSLLFNMLSRLVITFLPRIKCLLISWFNHHLQWFWSSEK